MISQLMFIAHIISGDVESAKLWGLAIGLMACMVLVSSIMDLYFGIKASKAAVLADIDHQTDEKILKECPWTVLHGSDGGKQVTLWLSAENQRNYSEGQRVAMITEGASLPMKFKVGQNEDGTAVYDIFETLEEITRFYIHGVNFINQTLNEGWQRKDSIDWCPYEQSLS